MSSNGNHRGFIVPIGGAEDKTGERAILARFADLCDGRIAILPTASESSETGPRYERLFGDLGVRDVCALRIDERSDSENPAFLEYLEGASGVFLTGGNQLRLSTTLGGTPVSDLLRRRHQEDGLHVAGTSAGAAFLSEHMIAYGDQGPTPRTDMVTLAAGAGLLQRVIIDQHFRQRDRLGRLLSAIAYNPRLVGIGVDEDTAAFIDPDRVFRVMGSGAVTVVDGSEVEHLSMDSAREDSPVSIIGLRVHVLVDGGSFDLESRTASPKSTVGARKG
jgi:cyanophycinase